MGYNLQVLEEVAPFMFFSLLGAGVLLFLIFLIFCALEHLIKFLLDD